MNRFIETFAKAKQEKRAALVGYITAGDPDLERSYQILDAACGAGLDILELGIPFSDPTADGPVIQRAALRSIRSGMTLAKGIELVRRLRQRHTLPIVLFTYYNPIIAFGTERFVTEAVNAGADGALVVDLPSESLQEIGQYTLPEKPFALIRLVSPTTDAERCRMILQSADGFVYVVSRRGVTGQGTIDWSLLANEIQTLRKQTQAPFCIGFGISTPSDVRSAAKIADGVIVGSAIEQIIESQPDNAVSAVTEFVRQLAAEL
ncbi:tryptophan synthase alpha chain [Planctomycetales bacterium]|nr:tryptophan synthase alpha chain [Planctomycetales bacterium]